MSEQPLTVHCLASYFKGNRFLERLKAEGCRVFLLTVEAVLHEPWPRGSLDDVFAVASFADRPTLVKVVAYLFRTHRFDRIVALDDFDVEVGAFLREQFRITDTGLGETQARFFRDKLAMRGKARELGIRIPDFAPLFDHAALRDFFGRCPGPWLIKPRSEASAAGIRRCASADDVWKAVEGLGDEQATHLIEQMVAGELFHVDSLVCKDEVIFAEANGYHRPLLDVYQGGGVYATGTLPRHSPDVAELQRVNALVLEGFGLGQGASHTEFMKAHADGEFYFIETSARVGGAGISDMVEAATGINLWSEWAKLEICRTRGSYELPPLKERYGGVVISLAPQLHPDTSGFTDPEIAVRMEIDHHIGFVLASDSPERIRTLMDDYMTRIARDFHAVLPAAATAGY